MSARRDAIVFHGTVEASAFLIDPSICGEEEARRRIIALWEPGVSVTRVDGAYVVRLAQKTTVAASRAPGLPLVARGGALIAFEPGERVEHGTLMRKVHGRTIVTSSEEAVDPARWIDIRGIATAAPPTLGKPPDPPRQVVKPEERDVRQIIPGAPPLSRGAAAAIKALMQAPSGEAKPASSGSGGGASSQGCLRPLAIVAFISIMGRLFSSKLDASSVLLILVTLAVVFVIVLLAGRRVVSAGASSTTSSAKPFLPAAPTRPRKPSRLRRWLTSLAVTTRLTSFIGRAHAKYLAKMLELFDEGNFEEALKHAIPLGGEGLGAGLAFTAPKPRASLALNPWRTGGAYTVPFHESIYNELQRRYRDAFERLDRAGRVEEAAFVLAELLRSSAEAVSYLEKKGQFRMAAEVAEARGLPPDVVVRQWLLAGEQTRAVAIARLRNAFSTAVAGLEKTHPDTAKLLRVHWAEWLASSGNYVAAVDVIWKVEESRALARAWIDRGIAQGGGPGARLIVRRLRLIPEEADDTAKRILALLDDEDPELGATRIALGFTLVEEPSSPHTRLISRVAARAVIRDGQNSMAIQLASRSGEQALRRDIPETPHPRPRWQPAPPLEIVFDANDTGATIVHDIALLHEGRVAVAQGESGLSIIGRDGKEIARLVQPAYRIVLSDAADRAIVIAPRGDVLRLARADFAARTAAFWCDARLGAWSSDYDGGIWFAAEGREILAIDATSSRLDSLWHNPDFPAPIFALWREESHLHILGDGKKIEHWKYELPSLILRAREPLDAVPRLGRWHVETSVDDDAARVVLSDTAVRATFVLGGARNVHTRLQAGTLAIGDDRGRAIIFDLVSGVIRRDLRL